MINHFTFNGTSTAQLGLIVSGVSIFGAGSRKVEKAGIPGRNGDLQIELGGFNNYTVRYTVSITKNFTTTAQQIREWLLESKGYCDLTDTYHPDEIRKACFNSDIEFTTSMLYKYGQATIQFDCLPERYLTTNTPITTTATADTTTDTTMSLSTVPTPINISLNGNTTQNNKNLLLNTATTRTTSGVTFTVNTDGTVNVNGTATADAYLIINNFNFVANQYTLSGCPSGGSTSTYALMLVGRPAESDTGSGRTVTQTVNNQAVGIFVKSGVTVTNLLFKPMIESGTTATSYVPYLSPTNPQEIHSVSGDNEISVTGKNILTPFIIGISINSNNGNEVPSVLGATTDYIPVDYDVNPNYYLSGISSTIHSFVCAYNSNKQFLGRTGSTLRNEIALPKTAYTSGTAQGTGDISYLRVTYYQQGTDTDVNTANNYLTQLEVGSTATTYEPYTRQSYPLYLPVENLFDFSTLANMGTNVEEIENGYSFTVSGTQYSTGAPISVNSGMLYVKCKIKNVTGKNLRVRVGYTDNTYNEAEGSGQSITGEWFNFSMTTNASKTVNKIMFNWSTRGIFEVKDFMVSYYNTVNYYPYGTTPIELNKIGTYQDYIYKNGGKWYLHKAIKKVTLDGTENWASDSRGLYLETNDMARTNNYIGNMLCDKLTVYTGATETDFTSQTYGITGWNLSSYPNQNWIYARANNETTPAGFKTWLSSNNLLVYYQLATPTNTEITDTTLINQLNNIEKAYSYNGTTNILQVSNDNGFMLEVVSLHGSTFNSNYKGEPIITVNSTGLIYLNGEVMEVLSAPVTINCQTMQCYNGVVNMNNEVRVNDFPEIKIGENTVGSSMALTITPNNWRH